MVVTMLAVLVLAATAAGSSHAGSALVYGIQDDAYLEYGPGTAAERVASLQHLGVGIVRFTLRWDAVEAAEGTDDWSTPSSSLFGMPESPPW